MNTIVTEHQDTEHAVFTDDFTDNFIHDPSNPPPKPTFVTLGLPDIDQRLGGGMRTGRLGIICGYTGFGKTSFGLQVARKNAEQSIHSRYVSFDSPGHDIQERFDKAIKCDPPLPRFKEPPQCDGSFPTSSNKFDYCMIEPVASQLLCSRVCQYFDVWDFTGVLDHTDRVPFVEQGIIQAREQGTDIKVIVIDSLQMMVGTQSPSSPGAGRGSRACLLEETAIRLKGIAMRHDVAIFLIVPSNQKGNDKTNPGMRSTGGCHAINDLASVWLGLGRLSRNGTVNLTCDKNEGGSIFKMKLNANFTQQHFSN